MSAVEHMLRDGGRFIIQGHNLVRRDQDGRVRDLSWWPLWKAVDLLRDQKIGGLDGAGEALLRERFRLRRHPAFATLDASINWQDLCWMLGRADQGTLRMQVHIAAGELPHADVMFNGRERFRVQASTRGAQKGCRVVLADDDQLINGTLVRAVGQLMQCGGQLERAPDAEGALSLTHHDGSTLSAKLLREPTQAQAMLDKLGVVSREVRVQCDLQRLIAHELRVRPEAQHLVIDF